MRQVLRAHALGKPRGIGWRGMWEGGLGWGIHVNPWLIHVNVWQKPLQYCKVISLQLIKINGKEEDYKETYLGKKFLLIKLVQNVKKKKVHLREHIISWNRCLHSFPKHQLSFLLHNVYSIPSPGEIMIRGDFLLYLRLIHV